MHHVGNDSDTESPLKYFTVVVTAQPADAVGVLGGSVNFIFTYSAIIPPLLTFQWQIQLDNGAWHDLQNTANAYSNVTTNSLSVKRLDNFLATRTVKFRCQILFAGTVPTFTDAAQLTIPLHTNWTAKPTGTGVGNSGGTATAILDPALLPSAVGFSGPYTYAWTNTGGEAFICSDPTIQNPTFDFTGADGLHFSVWTCTISNGGQSATTDPLYLFNFISFAGTVATPNTITTPDQVTDSFPMTGANFQSPWTVITQERIRCTAGVATPSFPTNATTGWNTAAAVLAGGQAIDAFVGYTYSSGGFSSFCIGTALLQFAPPI